MGLKRMMTGGRGKALVGAGIVVAAAVAAAALGAGRAAAAGATLYVSPSGSDANPCTFAAPCQTIGHAVTVASAGDTVVVEAGTYAEEVTLDKQLTLEGETGAVVDATGFDNGIVVTGAAAAGSVVEGLTVENAIGEGILVGSSTGVTIQHNVIQFNDQGFGTTDTPECSPNGNIPGDCGEGLHLMTVTNSRVLANIVQDNVGGILVTDELGPTSGNLIQGNVARDNVEDCGITLPSHNGAAMTDPSLGGVYDNTVTGNVSEGNGGAGVGIFAPFPGTAAYDNTVSHNLVRDNGEAGIAIHAHAPDQNVGGNRILFNTIDDNGVDPDSGSGHPTGIALFTAVSPATAVVSGNRISNEYWGIFFAGPITATVTAPNFMSNVTHPIGRGPVPVA